MIVYVDTSASLKRVLREPESPAVTRVLAEHDAAGDLLAASTLSWLEAWRTFRRAGLPRVDVLVEHAQSGIAEHQLDVTALGQARLVGPHSLRALDAIHLASAIAVNADALLTYDSRLAQAAGSLGLTVLAPA